MSSIFSDGPAINYSCRKPRKNDSVDSLNLFEEDFITNHFEEKKRKSENLTRKINSIYSSQVFFKCLNKPDTETSQNCSEIFLSPQKIKSKSNFVSNYSCGNILHYDIEKQKEEIINNKIKRREYMTETASKKYSDLLSEEFLTGEKNKLQHKNQLEKYYFHTDKRDVKMEKYKINNANNQLILEQVARTTKFTTDDKPKQTDYYLKVNE
jgi:hypothetical protein